jgi:hydrogenase/urease accessory protein HupE
MRWTVLAPLLFIACVVGARAHTGGTIGFATVNVDGASVSYSLALGPASLPAQLAERLQPSAPGAAPDYHPLLDAVAQHVRISGGGRACIAAPGQVTPPAASRTDLLIVISFVCEAPPRELSIRDDLADVLGSDYHTLANIGWPGGSTQFMFQPDRREARIVLRAAGPQGWVSFFTLGVEHILIGFDHLLFLLALVLRGGNAWSLLKIVTAFTIAHSITLALAALNIIVLPSRLVEGAIALSIAYVAAENLFAKRPASHRWAVSFVFGLVHGVGFSSVLREIGLPQDGLVWALLGFNLGVEAGQAIAVLATLPLLLYLRRTRFEARTVAAVSVIVLVAGLALFVERALLGGA